MAVSPLEPQQQAHPEERHGAPGLSDETLKEATRGFVRAVEARLDDLLTRDRAPAGTSADELWAAARHTCLGGSAKRIRPRLVYLFGQALGADTDAPATADMHERIAACAELLHAASLVHDDVIDEGTLRRGLPTVNVQWSNLSAVLCGDLMFALSFAQLSGLPRQVLADAVDLLRVMSCAAIDEVGARGDTRLPLDSWRAIARGKTGALFAWCGSAVALAHGDEEAAARFAACGERLGIAFQLADDLKDLLTDDGKDRYADIKNKNPSFPLLWVSERESAVAQALEALWAQPHIDPIEAERLGDTVVAAGAAEAARDALIDEVNAALDALGSYRDRPGMDVIAGWAHAMLERVGATALPTHPAAARREERC